MTVDQAIKWLDEVLDVVASEAEAYMKQYIHDHTKDATGALESSINTVPLGPLARSVGSSLKSESSGHVYGNYVDQGRGPVKAKHLTEKGTPGYLRFEIPRGGEVFYRRRVKAAKGIHFIDATERHILNKKI